MRRKVEADTEARAPGLPSRDAKARSEGGEVDFPREILSENAHAAWSSS